MKFQYCLLHRSENYDEIIDIIQNIKPEYYNMALNVSNETTVYLNNMFIMKKEDFLNIVNLYMMYYLNLIEDIISQLIMMF